MGVGADKGGDPPVGVIGERLLFGRCLGMEIHDAEGWMPGLFQQGVERFKGTAQGFHVDHANQVDDRHLIPAAVEQIQAAAGAEGG